MKALTRVSQIILGLVFTTSGFLKAIDPLGSGYKFSDYFTDAFGLPSLSLIALPLAILLNTMEFLVGVSLLLNVKPRLSSLGALLFMIIFTPLTLYIAIKNPVQDCGCFGDAIKISNWGTFYKNIILLALSIISFTGTKGKGSTYKGFTDWILALSTLIVIVGFQLYTLNHLPIIDFMPYKVGTYIPDKMKIPAGEKPDSFAIFYTMKHLKTSETMKADDNEYLKKEIWKDTLWQITETSEPVLVKKGYKPPIYNFKAYEFNELSTSNNVDAMEQILNEKGFTFLVIAYDLKKSDIKGFQKMKELLNYAYAMEVPVCVLTSSSNDINEYRSNIPFIAKYYISDPTALKTVIRANPGLLLLKSGKIIGKWHFNDIPTIKEYNKLLIKNKD
ncbi:MAG: DoxX family membrane protein [Bacteroidales bacterium]